MRAAWQVWCNTRSAITPCSTPKRPKARQLTVLRLMIQAGYLDDAERDQIAADHCAIVLTSLTSTRPTLSCMCKTKSCNVWAPMRCGRAACASSRRLTSTCNGKPKPPCAIGLTCSTAARPAFAMPKPTPIAALTMPPPSFSMPTPAICLTMIGSPDYFDASIQGNVNAAVALAPTRQRHQALYLCRALDPAWAERMGLAPLTAGHNLARLARHLLSRVTAMAAMSLSTTQL